MASNDNTTCEEQHETDVHASSAEKLRQLVRKHTVLVNGFVYPAYLERPPGRVLRVMNEFPHRDTDVWIVTYPKCGTTWMQEIVLRLRDGSDAKVRHEYDSPWPEATLFANKAFPIPGSVYTVNELNQMRDPRVIKMHSPYFLMPGYRAATGDFLSTMKMIIVIREPKDAFVSAFYHWRRVGATMSPDFRTMDWDDFFEVAFADEMFWGSFWRFYIGWYRLALKHPQQIMFVRYEDLHERPVEECTRLSKFLHWPAVEDDHIARAMRKAKFEEITKVRNPKTSRHSKEGNFDHFRKGIVGDWASHFSYHQTRRIDEKTARLFAGYPLLEKYITSGDPTEIRSSKI